VKSSLSQVGTPSISPNPVCVNVQYCVNWSAVSGATSYEVSENEGPWQGVGNVTSWCTSKGSAGSYSYRVRAVNSCGAGSPSNSASVTVNGVPGQVSTPSVSPNPVCVNVQYCVNWSAVSGATAYEISENEGPWQGVGNVTSWCTSKGSAGSYSYRVRAVNSSGCYGASSASAPILVTTQCYYVEGVVYDDGGVLQNEIVDLYLYSSPALPSKCDTTDSEGKYRIQQIPQGRYLIGCKSFHDVYNIVVDSDIIGKNIRRTGSGVYTPVEDFETDMLPKGFTLAQNSPNPFNLSTVIEFDLPKTSFVTIDVLNILGGRVRTLVQETLSPGHRFVTWDGHDSNGHDVASGVYFYRMQADEYSETKRMILMK